MKKLLFGIMMLCSLCGNAQILVGDMDDDNNITVSDVTAVVNTAIGKTAKRYITPYHADNTSIVGTWYKRKTESITFNEDGTTSLGDGYTYKYRPNIGKVSIYDTSGNSVADYEVYDISASVLEMGICGNSSHSFYTSEVPIQLTENIALNKSSLTLAVDGSYTLSATVSPSYVDNESVIWSSSDNNIATVSSDGLVKGVGAGTVIITCIASDGSGVKATCTVTVDTNLLPGKFSVSATKQVLFTKSNIYWDGSNYKFEENPTDYPTKWDANHLGNFSWTSYTDYQSGYHPYAQSYSYSNQSASDKFWCCEDNPLTIEGISDLYVLTGGDSGEWDYLINSRNNASNLYKYGVTVGDAKNCLIIAPDDFSGTLQSSYTLEEVNTLGLVCLPAAGVRVSSSINGGGSSGYYWSATPHHTNAAYAYYFYFTSSSINIIYNKRDLCLSLRLVRNI